MEDLHNKYLGTEKIRGTVEDGDMCTITLKNNEVHEVPTILIPRLVTDEPNESGGDVQDMKIAGIAKDICELLNKAYHLKLGEVDTLIQFLQNLIGNDYNAATTVLWGKHRLQVRLEDMSKILTERAEELKKIREESKGNEETKKMIKRQQEIQAGKRG